MSLFGEGSLPGEGEVQRAGGAEAETTAPVLLMGVGNYLLQDEGVGIHLIAGLMEEPWPAGVRLVDGGTGGFHLLALLEEAAHAVILDAALEDTPPGTLQTRHPRFARDFPPTLSAHDIGLRELFGAAHLLGRLPPVTLITISVQADQPVRIGLSPEISAALEPARDAARQAVARALATTGRAAHA